MTPDGSMMGGRRLVLILALALFSPPSEADAKDAHKAGRTAEARQAHDGIVRAGNTHDAGGRPTVALTFDDGPHPTLTPRLLDILKRTGAKATFYVLGNLAEKHPEIIRRMMREGHEVGNHTWSHRDLRKLGDAEIRRELDRTDGAVRAAGGPGTFSMRPPYGAINKRVVGAISEAHHPIVMWTVDPLDWKRPGSGVVASRLLEGAAPGAILLCHDIHPGTIDAIETVVPKLAGRGYTFSTVSEILAQTQTLELDLDHDP